MNILFFVVTEPVVLGLIAFAVALAVGKGRFSRAHPTEGSSVFVHRVAVVGSAAVLLPFVIVGGLPILDLASRYLVPSLGLEFWSPPDYRWWMFPLPVIAAVVVLLIALNQLSRVRSQPEEPVAPVARRTWFTFARPRDLVLGACVLGSLVLVSVLAGLASVTDEGGLHTLIRIPGGDTVPPAGGPVIPPDQSGGSATFYGWAYSVPVIAATLVLTVIAYWALRVSSIRPFRRPETVRAETAERRMTASTILWLFIPAILLPLGGALDLIGSAGLSSGGVGIPGVGTFMWSVGYSAFAPEIVAIGTLLQAVAVAILLFGVSGFRSTRATRSPAVETSRL
jgi:hypothetical protein